ncbi:MAG: DUF1559 domain-containing protein, partial [Planctomycetota bacterium]
DIEDGLANTISIGEIAGSGQWAINQPERILRSPKNAWEVFREPKPGAGFKSDVDLASIRRGALLADGAAAHSLFQTILPPGAPSCSTGREANDGLFSASSMHTGGVNLAMLDGSVHFIGQNIDVNDLGVKPPVIVPGEKQPKSPYGVWGLLGSARGNEAHPNSIP